MIDCAVSCLSQAPAELAQDIIVQGINLVGGGSLLKGFDTRLSEETDVPVNIVPNALEAVVLGQADASNHLNQSVQCLWMTHH